MCVTDEYEWDRRRAALGGFCDAKSWAVGLLLVEKESHE